MLEPDSGCAEFSVRFDVNNNGYFDLPVTYFGIGNDYIRLYFGNALGFNKDSVRLYPVNKAGGGTCFSDLNCDGNSEFINSGWQMPLAIYWGTSTGPSITNVDTLPSKYGETVYTADFNKDGFLDIAICSYASSGFGDSLYIYWGTLSGYNLSNYTSYSTSGGGGHNLEVGDLDKDGWLDIVVVSVTHGPNSIIYSPGNVPTRVDLEFVNGKSGPHGSDIADLNNDGWLDIIFTGCGSITESYIYWGSDSGFTAPNKLVLYPGQCFGGVNVVDVNNDGWLDILYLRGIYPNTTFLPIIYMNQKGSPYFLNSDTLTVGTRKFTATSGFVADFNFDGNLDIFINNFTTPLFSYILYGPSYTSCDSLPNNKGHHSSFMDPGNTYTREYNSSYVSSIFDACSIFCNASADWIAYEPTGAEVKVDLRGGNTITPDSTWSIWKELSKNQGDTLQDTVGLGRYFQYRARFLYENPCNLPWLEEITINLWKDVAGIETKDKKQKKFNIYTLQNPIRDKAEVTFEIPVSGNLNSEIYNLVGEKIGDLIVNKKFPVGTYKKTLSIDNNIRTGVYFCLCKFETETYTIKRIIKFIIVK
ncbi:MAG: FG-GAP-like repeat-containing protein [bacterium]